MISFFNAFTFGRCLILILLFSNINLLGKTIKIKLATLAPDGSPWYELLVEMGEEWREATDGEVILKIYPGGVAGDERDMIRKMRIGQLHAAAVTIEGLTEISPNMNVFYIPMLVDSFKELDEIRTQLLPELTEDLEKNGFKLLNWADVGWAYWFTREPIATPSDLADIKLFTWAGDYRWADLWKKAGFHPVPLASVDLLPSLQTGMIDAFSTTPMVALSFQWFGLAPYMLDLKWGPLIGAIIITNRMWKKIPEEHQKVIIEVAAATEKKAQQLVQEVEKAINVMEEHGLKIHSLSPEERRSWINLTKSFYPHFRGTIIPENIYDKVIQLKENMDKSGTLDH